MFGACEKKLGYAMQDRRVQFASGPWDHYVDGHPPEKRCEEDRRAYRLGLTLQQDLEPSLFEQDWFDICSKASKWWSADVDYTKVEMDMDADWSQGSEVIEADYGAGSNALGLRHDSATSIGGYSPGKSQGTRETSESMLTANESESSLLLDAVSISMPSCGHFPSADDLENKPCRIRTSSCDSSLCRYV